MNINLRAVLFGTAIAAVLTTAMNTVAAENVPIIRLPAVEIVAHRTAPIDGRFASGSDATTAEAQRAN